MTLARTTALAVAVASSLAGCSTDPTPVPAPAPSPTTSTSPDELAPGELAESPIEMFGLVLPAGLRIVDITDSRIQARGLQPFEAVANFVRHRVDAERVVTGPARTTFENAKIKKPSARPREAPPGEQLRIEVGTLRGETTITCSKYRPVEIPANLNDDERWGRSGLRKDGKPLDPKKFE